MEKQILKPSLAVLAALTCTLPAVAQTAEEPKAITPYADIRYRLELVGQDGLPENATASTLRVRAGFKTSEWSGFSALVEGDAIARVGPRHYNDTVNGLTAYPIVADPSDVLLNQAWLRYKPVKEVEAVLGRQAVNFDNQRWIGSVGWRQNDQTLDAARVTIKPMKGVALDYGYAWRVNRIFGPDSPQGIWRDDNIHMVRANFEAKPVGTVTTYGYFLDLPDAPLSSSKTIGVRLAGEQKLSGKAKLLYAAEYANQRDLGSNPRNFSLDYLLVEPGISLGAVTVKAGWEQLEGNGVSALQTPLATLHAFNGWADKFLNTPANGLRDLYADVAVKLPAVGPIKGASARLQYHDYNSTRGGLNYGSELGAMLAVPIDKQLTATLKFARYNEDDFATDTTKFWFSLDLKL
ncbi:MAG: alginate export family protein [Sphingomonadaceae bacterium]|nr:alginate export family protein [Sphingomonadaceae bacterium]